MIPIIKYPYRLNDFSENCREYGFRDALSYDFDRTMERASENIGRAFLGAVGLVAISIIIPIVFYVGIRQSIKQNKQRKQKQKSLDDKIK